MKSLRQKLNESFQVNESNSKLTKEIKEILLNKYGSFKAVKDALDNDFSKVLDLIKSELETDEHINTIVKTLKQIINTN